MLLLYCLCTVRDLGDRTYSKNIPSVYASLNDGWVGRSITFTIFCILASSSRASPDKAAETAPASAVLPIFTVLPLHSLGIIPSTAELLLCAKAPKPPKQKKEKRSARKQRIAYEQALKKTSAEKTLSLIASGLALVGTVFQALLDNKKDQD